MTISRTFCSFFVFGLINNVLYVIILTSAHDLVSPTTPKSLILLADIVPSFLLKLVLPLLNTYVPDITTASDNVASAGLGINYPLRLACIVTLSCVGMLITSLPLPLWMVLIGIIFASFSAGLGETTFLQLSHYYNHDGKNYAIHGWSSGTGGAGLVGAGLILILTTIIKLPIGWVLRCCALIPVVNLWVYYKLLPAHIMGCISVDTSAKMTVSARVENGDGNGNDNGDDDDDDERGLLRNGTNDADFMMDIDVNIESLPSALSTGKSVTELGRDALFGKILYLIKKYFFVYMLPLSIVYFAEYAINQGVAPTMLFPLEETPFTTFRDSYVTYGTIYQIGVFISRSSGSFIKIGHLYTLGFLQLINLIVCILQSVYMFIPNIWFVFILIFYEGLLGGGAYVNTFMKVSEEVAMNEREFALGCVGISDSFGIVLAASVSMWLEPALCGYQTRNGRDWCTQK
jgi:battenin